MAEIVKLEKKLEASLVRLKNKFGLYAIKAEFEAEGASFRDLVRLRRLTARHNILLFISILNGRWVGVLCGLLYNATLCCCLQVLVCSFAFWA